MKDFEIELTPRGKQKAEEIRDASASPGYTIIALLDDGPKLIGEVATHLNVDDDKAIAIVKALARKGYVRRLRI